MTLWLNSSIVFHVHMVMVKGNFHRNNNGKVHLLILQVNYWHCCRCNNIYNPKKKQCQVCQVPFILRLTPPHTWVTKTLKSFNEKAISSVLKILFLTIAWHNFCHWGHNQDMSLQTMGGDGFQVTGEWIDQWHDIFSCC